MQGSSGNPLPDKRAKVELRVCLIWGDFGQTANHQMDHRHLDEGFTGFRQQVVIFTEASIAIEPPEGAFHHPALGDDHTSLDGVRALRNLQADRPLGPQRPHPVHQRSGIGPVGPDVPQPRLAMSEALQELCRAIAVLHPGGCHDHREDESEGIDEEMTLATFDLFAGIVPTEPPFSVVLTD
jgi:hypothetical protein